MENGLCRAFLCSATTSGFEDFERTLDRITKMQPEPPVQYRTDRREPAPHHLAVAGFSENVSVQLEDNQLLSGVVRKTLAIVFLRRE